jgi:hypothetical protein
MALFVNYKLYMIIQYLLFFFNIAMAVKVIRDDGFLTLYNGLSASCLRQATYTTTRFAIYGSVKSLKGDSNLSFFEKVSLAAASGAVGAFVGKLISF